MASANGQCPKARRRFNAKDYLTYQRCELVTLEIDQVVEEISRLDERLGPTTSKRAESTVVVKDQNTVVTVVFKRVNKATVRPRSLSLETQSLATFSEARRKRDESIYYLLTPYVIEGPNDFKTIMKRKLEEHREFAERFHKKAISSSQYRLLQETRRARVNSTVHQRSPERTRIRRDS